MLGFGGGGLGLQSGEEGAELGEDFGGVDLWWGLGGCGAGDGGRFSAVGHFADVLLLVVGVGVGV